MNRFDLLTRHANEWHEATHHPFLDAVRDGTLAPQIFATWLVQDYLFVRDELMAQALLLARAPRSAQHLLVQGLVGLESELSWFEEHAQRRQLALEVERHPVTAAYHDFWQSLSHKPYPVAITATWAAEQAYLDAWTSLGTGVSSSYREYIEHWANADFEHFVSELGQMSDIALATGDHDQEVEDAFLSVAHLEHDFWQMAWSGGR